LVFDQATSALDNETEAAVAQAINQLQGETTMIAGAHRLSTIERCDLISELRKLTEPDEAVFEPRLDEPFPDYDHEPVFAHN
jgi:ABC-type transport system involved in cytochrome bd biosynthesis fused ATPase/permease subunit